MKRALISCSVAPRWRASLSCESPDIGGTHASWTGGRYNPSQWRPEDPRRRAAIHDESED